MTSSVGWSIVLIIGLLGLIVPEPISRVLVLVVPVICVVGFLHERRLLRARQARFSEYGSRVCLACGYARIGIQDSEPCPECGAPHAHAQAEKYARYFAPDGSDLEKR